MAPRLRVFLLGLVAVCSIHIAATLAWTPEPAQGGPALWHPVAPADPPSTGVPGLLATEEPDFDFHTLLEGACAWHVFQVGNPGGQRVRLLRVRSSCGCAVARLACDSLEPGERSPVTVRFSARAVGAFRKTVTVDCEPGGPLQFSVRGVVAPRFQIDPRVLNFGFVAPGQEVTRSLVVYPASPGVELRLGLVRCDNPAVSVLPPVAVASPPGGYRLEVRARVTERLQSLNGRLVLKTGDSEVPELTVPLGGLSP